MLTRRMGRVATAGMLIMAFGMTGCRDADSYAGTAAGATAPAVEQAGDETFMLDEAPMPLLARLDRRLDLTAAQRAEVREVLRRERRALCASGAIGRGPDQIHAWLCERKDRVAGELARCLSPAQRETFAGMRARAGALTARGAGHGQVITELLGLDDAQQARAAALLDRKRQALRGFRDEALTGRLTRAEVRERARLERDKFHAELEEILTPAQKARLAELIKERQADRREWREERRERQADRRERRRGW